MIAQFLVMVAFPALLIAAAVWDLASYTIPNALPVALVATFAAFALATGMPLAALGGHALAGAVALVIAFGLFAFGYIGGGDAKLFAAIALMLGLRDAAAFGLLASVFGGALTLGLLAIRQVPLPRFLAQPWILRLHDTDEGVPYGVALAAGAFVLLPYTALFRLAAHA